jgi:hypothetical protein
VVQRKYFNFKNKKITVDKNRYFEILVPVTCIYYFYVLYLHLGMRKSSGAPPMFRFMRMLPRSVHQNSE